MLEMFKSLVLWSRVILSLVTVMVYTSRSTKRANWFYSLAMCMGALTQFSLFLFQAVDCGPVTAPLNGSKHGLLSVYPNTIKFSCDVGFLLRGIQSITCESTAKWSDRVPKCEGKYLNRTKIQLCNWSEKDNAFKKVNERHDLFNL